MLDVADLEKRWGGRRKGAGRKPGGVNALPQGTVGAISAAAIAERRLGKQDAPPEARAALNRVSERLVDVLEERVSPFMAGHVLKAATTAAEWLAGPTAQRLEHSGPGGAPIAFALDLSEDK